MFIRNGIKSNLRAKGRTALFSLLIFFLTATVILSLSVLLYCNNVLDACGRAYRSIALVEYMGSEYPGEDVPDAAARAAAEELTDEAVLSVPGVTAWTRGNTAFASVEGYERRAGTMPYGGRGVIVVSRVSAPLSLADPYASISDQEDMEEQPVYYTATMKTALYARSGKEGTYIDLLAGTSGFIPEKGKSYILNGSFISTASTARQAGEYPTNGYVIFRVESFLDSDDLPYLEYDGESEIPEVFLRAADQYRIMNNFVHVVPCRNVNDVYVFQQNELHLAEGSMPDPGVPFSCVISNDLAQRLELTPGDIISLDELRGTMEDRYYLKPAGSAQTFTVSGIAAAGSTGFGTVWLISEDADTPLFGYLLGTVSLRNDMAETASEALQALVPEQVRVTLLDQGYSDAVKPFHSVRKTAVDILLVCSAGVAAVLLLFAFLFVGRQSSTVRIMVSLGTPGGKIALWFLSGALFICGAAVVSAVILGTALRPALFRAIADAAAAARTGNGPLWFSETVLGIVKQDTFDPQVPLWPNLLAALGIMLLTVIFCLLFLRLARQGWTRKRGKSRVRVPRGRTSVRHRNGLRFALLSIRRGGLRSLVVPLVSLVLTITVLVLGGVYQGWQNELDYALDNTHIDGMVVSLDGRYYSGLTLSVSDVRTLMAAKGVDSVSLSCGYHYWLPEDAPDFAQNAFGREHRIEWISSQPELVSLNALEAAREFYYRDPAVTWLEGWNESMLTETEVTPLLYRYDEVVDERPIPVVCSTSFLDEHGLTLGSTFRPMVQVAIDYFSMEVPVVLHVVGSYVQHEGKASIFAPLSCYIPLSLLTGSDDPSVRGNQTLFTFRTCRFRLASARELETIRKQLRSTSFSAVNRPAAIRMALLLRDAAFLKFREGMEHNITMGRIMSAILSLMIILLGFIISWLMTFSRQREFALMRGFGTKKRQVFASFFLEQAILCLVGCLAGCAALFWLYAGGITQPLAAAAYLICYLLGTAVSILIIRKTNLMELLAVRD